MTPTLKLSDWWGLKLHFDSSDSQIVCPLFQFYCYSSASIAQLLIHILSTHTRMLSTQNLAMRNRRVDEVPPEAGDFARIVNGSLFSLNGGRSSESTFDLNRGHLYWITSVLNQFDKTPSAPIKFSERVPKPPTYSASANCGWIFEERVVDAATSPPACTYLLGPSLVKQNDLSPWMCLCCADLAKLHRSMTDNSICISYSTSSKILILVSLILHQLLYQSAALFRSMIYKLATTCALKMTKER